MEKSKEMSMGKKIQLFRRVLHQYPELSMEEFETTRRIQAFLQEAGIEILPYSIETGVLAIIRGKDAGPCVALRADIDALPILENTNLPFASKISGKMHACGHDFHTSALLGAALLLKELAESSVSFAGSVLLVFQPAEEVGKGAQMMLDTGVFAAYQVCCIIGEHNNPLLPSGKIGVKSGSLMGSVDEFRIVVRGKGGHAAIPDAAIDPIVVAAQIVSSLQSIVSRTISPLDNSIVTVGQFHAGTAANIIPMEAVLEGTVRCLQPENRDRIESRFAAIVQSTASAFGAEVEILYERQLPAVVNDEAIAQLLRQAASKVVGKNDVVDATPTLAGEDFAVYQEHLPGCFFWVGTGRQDGSSQGWHHPAFDVDEEMLEVTSRIFVEAARLALHYFSERA